MRLQLLVLALLTLTGVSSGAANCAPINNLVAEVQKPPPRQFDFACKMTVTKRMNGTLVSERPAKPVLLHVDLAKGKWCRDRCTKTYSVQQMGQYGAITLAHVDTSVMNTDISIMPSAGGYSETYLADLPGRSGSTEYDGDCKVQKLTALK